MHFIPEACYRRPLEPKTLVYSRGGTAILMGMIFLTLCGYLATLIYYDNYLILLSTEDIREGISPPDIEFCVQNLTMSIVQCNVKYVNRSSFDIPDCYSRFFREDKSRHNAECHVFETNGTYKSSAFGNSNDSVIKFDFYWRFNVIPNVTYTLRFAPSIELQLYDSTFSPWIRNKLDDTPAEKLRYENLSFGSQRATAYINTTTTVFFKPQKYRAIKPNNPRAILGFEPDYVDIRTLSLTQMDWPLLDTSPPGTLDRSLFQGILTIMSREKIIEVKSEARQHTLLTTISLAGGYYGVLTTLYIIMFGMTRLTPWGLVHHIPVFISNHRHNKKKDQSFEETLTLNNDKKQKGCDEDVIGFMDELNDDKDRKSKKTEKNTTELIPWFFRRNLKGTTMTTDSKTSILKRLLRLNNAKKNNIHESMIELESKISFNEYGDSSIDILDESNPALEATTNEPKLSIEEVNELSTAGNFLLNTSSSMVKNQQQRQSTSASFGNLVLPQAVTSPTSLFFDQSNNHSKMNENNVVSLTTTTSSDNILIKTNDNKLYQQKNNKYSMKILTEEIRQEKRKVRELATEVEELKIILGQYFIDTVYLDQLRTRGGKSFIDVNNSDVKKNIRKPSNDEQ